MSICKECFHYEACNRFNIDLELPTTDQVDADKYCGCYKNAADVVPVVRCGDCKRWKADGGYGLDLDGTKRLYGECSLMKLAVKENHFCYFGSRRITDEKG